VFVALSNLQTKTRVVYKADL